MVSGVVITAAAPAVAAAAVGYGAYKLHRYLRSGSAVSEEDKPTTKDPMTENELEEKQLSNTVTEDRPD